ncbi:hypothetical protein P8452_05881 [Trifolium repens]|nr:hypothetical protein P8452_05881 [Trifolium repens]
MRLITSNSTSNWQHNEVYGVIISNKLPRSECRLLICTQQQKIGVKTVPSVSSRLLVFVKQGRSFDSFVGEFIGEGTCSVFVVFVSGPLPCQKPSREGRLMLLLENFCGVLKLHACANSIILSLHSTPACLYLSQFA